MKAGTQQDEVQVKVKAIQGCQSALSVKKGPNQVQGVSVVRLSQGRAVLFVQGRATGLSDAGARALKKSTRRYASGRLSEPTGSLTACHLAGTRLVKSWQARCLLHD